MAEPGRGASTSFFTRFPMECTRMNTPQWLSAALSDPHVTDLCINGDHGVFIDRGLGLEPYDYLFPEDHLRNWVLSELSSVGKTWDAKYPFVDATLLSGHRL